MVHSDHWERQKVLTSTAHQSSNKTKYLNKAKISVKWEKSVIQREQRRERVRERNTCPRVLLYLCDYLAKPTMAHGGYNKRRVKPAARRSKGLGIKKKPKPKSISLKNQIRSIDRMLKKVLLISRSVVVETRGSWSASTRSSWAGGAAIPDFQSPFCSLSLSLSLSLS